ncbi:MAG: 3-phosphoshikimate 1-carboxyvinyltransferase, partial [Pseudomonadota bacterium]
TDPLALFGARSYGRSGGRLPLTIVGAADPGPVEYRSPVPSAQVKSAVLLAGLNAPGITTLIEAEATRDHTERMLRSFGAEVETDATPEGRVIRLTGQPELSPQAIAVPRDPSSAAFPICAALMVEGSDVLAPNISLNPTRAGLYETLREMGAELTYENRREEGGEPVADIRARFSPAMRGLATPPERAASMIDEFPILSCVAACAEGATVMQGVKELRVKESDRIDAMARGLEAIGVKVEETEDSFTVHGLGPGGVPGGGRAEARLDHRIAMSFLCLGMAAREGASVDDGSPIDTSFPVFEELMGELGGSLSKADE